MDLVIAVKVVDNMDRTMNYPARPQAGLGNLEAAASTGDARPEGTAAEAGSETESGTLSNERVQEWFSRYVYPRSPDASAQDSISPSPPP